jgi:hypothetical protein
MQSSDSGSSTAQELNWLLTNGQHSEIFRLSSSRLQLHCYDSLRGSLNGAIGDIAASVYAELSSQLGS